MASKMVSPWAKSRQTHSSVLGLEVTQLGNHLSTSCTTMTEIALNVNPHMNLEKVILMLMSG